MKYRMLTAEEMKIFDEDFKYFLIANGVKNEEWLEMNEQDVSKASELVSLFSDSVLQKVYEKINYLEFRDKSSCLVFHFETEKISVISLNSNSAEVDLSTPQSIHVALIHHPDALKFFKSTKPYSDQREMEIHQMLEQGCVPSSIEFWEALEKTVA